MRWTVTCSLALLAGVAGTVHRMPQAPGVVEVVRRAQECAERPKPHAFVAFTAVSAGAFRARNAPALASKRCYAAQQGIPWHEDSAPERGCVQYGRHCAKIGRLATAARLACHGRWLAYFGAFPARCAPSSHSAALPCTNRWQMLMQW